MEWRDLEVMVDKVVLRRAAVLRYQAVRVVRFTSMVMSRKTLADFIDVSCSSFPQCSTSGRIL